MFNYILKIYNRWKMPLTGHQDFKPIDVKALYVQDSPKY